MNSATDKQVAFLTKLVNRTFKFADSARIAADVRAELEAGKLTTRGASVLIETMLAQATV